MSDNLAIFVGNVGQDSELKEVGKDNTLVLNFSIAVKTGYGNRAETLWVQCAIWGDRAEKLEEYIVKGTKLVVKGEVTPEAYENKDNDIVANLRLNVSDFSFAGGKEDGGGSKRRSRGDDGDDRDSGSKRSSSSGRSRRSSSSRSSSHNSREDKESDPENEGMDDRFEDDLDKDIPY